MITIVRSGPLTTVQDLGRPGWAHLGVPRSGALDGPALRHANRLVGNPDGAAGLETTLLGCAFRPDAATTIAVTGAAATIRVDGTLIGASSGAVIDVPAGALVDVGRATVGVRSYVAFAGGIDVDEVLGSRSTDTLSGLGPPRLANGHTLPLGVPQAAGHVGGEGPVSGMSGGDVVLGVRLGPREDWVLAAALRELFGVAYSISPMSNRVGARLAGPSLGRARAGELASEGVVLGAIQVPPDGQPLIFLADHPTTGGYPVIGVVDDVTPLAQARPGTTVRFHGSQR
jgi:biotin-dependent carboxylase-like uncharacterized protein